MEYFIFFISIFTLGLVVILYSKIKQSDVSNKNFLVYNNRLLKELIKMNESSSDVGEKELWLQKTLDMRLSRGHHSQLLS
jgi:hypothetical protein